MVYVWTSESRRPFKDYAGEKKKDCVAENFLQGPTKLDGKDKIKYLAKSWVMPRENGMLEREGDGQERGGCWRDPCPSRGT